MSIEDGGHRDAAIAALADRRYEAAADRYTRSGRRLLADPRSDVGPFDDDEKGWVGRGLEALVVATLAYRVAGRPERATRRAVEGVAVAQDLRSTLDRPVQAACLTEVVADCRAAGGLADAAATYEDAAAAYRDCGDAVDDPQYWGTTPLFEAAAAPLKQAARGPANGEIAVTWEDLHGDDPSDPGPFLARRATVKRQRFPALVERVVGEGDLAAPRGTTAYGNDAFRCPHCGSNDVNWVGDDELCLRCSRPLDRV